MVIRAAEERVMKGHAFDSQGGKQKPVLRLIA